MEEGGDNRISKARERDQRNRSMPGNERKTNGCTFRCVTFKICSQWLTERHSADLLRGETCARFIIIIEAPGRCILSHIANMKHQILKQCPN